VIAEVKRLMAEAGVTRLLAIRAIVDDPAWAITLNRARSRRASVVGAGEHAVASWCDEVGLTTMALRAPVIVELIARGGDQAAAESLLEDSSWRSLILAARSKGSGRMPVARTLLRWLKGNSVS